VACGLASLPAGCDTALVHDAARPFFTATLVERLLSAIDDTHHAAVPGIPVTDTIKITRGDDIESTLDRTRLVAVQTPQAFDAALLRRAHAHAEEQTIEGTDDASLVEMLGERVAVVQGEHANVKITNPEDLALLGATAPESMPCPVTGFGYDVHKYGPGRPMVLGTVPIAGGPEVVAHSDGDVLLHALADALLGMCGSGDIGRLFPDTEAANDNLPSSVIVDRAVDLVREAGIRLVHVDITLIAQIPKISPHVENIRKNVASLLGLPPARVGLKATTEEGLGFTGEKKGIKAVAVASGLLTAHADLPGAPD
jgi:2-C-methyl-D-erythritol 4-phosphate cytidylyltransferase/2-C-methyl-D-erythritol 2,4-cyclodiphosphate synthase